MRQLHHSVLQCQSHGGPEGQMKRPPFWPNIRFIRTQHARACCFYQYATLPFLLPPRPHSPTALRICFCFFWCHHFPSYCGSSFSKVTGRLAIEIGKVMVESGNMAVWGSGGDEWHQIQIDLSYKKRPCSFLSLSLSVSVCLSVCLTCSVFLSLCLFLSLSHRYRDRKRDRNRDRHRHTDR